MCNHIYDGSLVGWYSSSTRSQQGFFQDLAKGVKMRCNGILGEGGASDMILLEVKHKLWNLLPSEMIRTSN